MPAVQNQPNHHLKAVLGPTNTGKTHLAVERMLGHKSGMIGLPLRLLAREVYDKVVAAKGKTRVALITGEEKILPPKPAYYISTTEAMPLSEPVSFMAIDEIQLAGDRERGHTFTNRLLNARGSDETMLMGASTIEPIIRALLPGAEIIRRARFSELSYVKPKKLTRLAKRTAVIAFSLERVYAVAELLRRTYGGVAVVMGALSPTTRNRQVELYQSGEVDYIVATDAIGMGLNMDIDHVVFADVEKFDGRIKRKLTPAELAQVAGRAGRYMNSGTFTCLSEIGDGLTPLDIERIENHRFPPLKKLEWRSSALDYGSVPKLIKSLQMKPDHALLSPAEEALDLAHLKTFASSPGFSELSPADVQMLWQVCRIPDFLQFSEGHHFSLINTLYEFLKGEGVIPHKWMAKQVSSLDNASGNIETLMHKIASIRTWTYISHHPGWLSEAQHWAFVTRTIEDKLSEALHERIQQRFVDRRTSALMKNIGDKKRMTTVDKDGTVAIEGHILGKLSGFCFSPTKDLEGEDAKALLKQAEKTLRPLVADKAESFLQALQKDLTLDLSDGGRARIIWEGHPIAALSKGQQILAPEVQLLGQPMLGDKDARNVLSKLKIWIKASLEEHLETLVRLNRAVHNEKSDLPGLTRGLAFKMLESLGVVARHYVTDDIKALSAEDRKALHRVGFWFGANFVYLPRLLKPAPTKWRLALWGIWEGIETWPALPEPGVMWAETLKSTPKGFYQTLGYRPVGTKAVRIDRLESLFDAVRPLGQNNAFFAITPEIMGLVGLSGDDFASVMRFLGYAHRVEIPKQEGEEEPKPVYTFKWSPKKPTQFKPGGGKTKPPKGHKKPASKPAKSQSTPKKDYSDCPFAVFQNLNI